MAQQITKDSAYNTVSPNDFKALVEVDRFGDRSDAFDKIISATHDHFWDPLDKKYIDFDDGFDIDSQMIMPEDMIPSLQTEYVQKNLKAEDRVRFANEVARWQISSILHGEQGALSLSASLCHILRDPGQEFGRFGLPEGFTQIRTDLLVDGRLHVAVLVGRFKLRSTHRRRFFRMR